MKQNVIFSSTCSLHCNKNVVLLEFMFILISFAEYVEVEDLPTMHISIDNV